MCPRLTPKAPWLAFISGTGWNRGIIAAVLASCSLPRRPWLLEAAETPYIPSRPVGRSTLRDRRKLSAEWIDHQLHAPVVGEGVDLAGRVTGAVVDGVIQAASRQKSCLPASAVPMVRAAHWRHVERSRPTPDPVPDEHGAALAEVALHHEALPGGQVATGIDAASAWRQHPRLGEDLGRRDVQRAAVVVERVSVRTSARPVTPRPPSHRTHRARDLVATTSGSGGASG